MLKFISSKFASFSSALLLLSNLSMTFILGELEIVFYILRLRLLSPSLLRSVSFLNSPDFKTELNASKFEKRRSLKLMRLETEPYVMPSSSILVCEACDWMTET